MKCSDCHTNATADTDSFAFGTAGVINTTEWSSKGHGQPVGALFTAATVFPTIAAGQPCLYCHDGDKALTPHDKPSNPFRLNGASAAGVVSPGTYDALSANNGNEVCLNCHGTGSTGVTIAGTNRNGTKKINEWHAGGKHGTSTSGKRCWDCHDPHGDTNSAMIGKTVNKAPGDVYGFAGTRAATNFTLSATPVGSDYASNTDATKVCNVCHTAALHYKNAAPIGDSHMAAADCTRCHGHQQGTVPAPNAFLNKDAATCNACHQGPPTAPATSLAGSHAAHYAVTTNTTYANATDNTTAAAYGFACAKCHPSAAANHMNDTTHVGTAASRLTAEVIAGLGFTVGTTPASDVGPSMLEFQTSNATCNATYCHSNAAPVGGLNARATPTWGEASWAANVKCTKCHQVTADNPASASSTKLSHAHWLHVTTAVGGGYYFNCSQCHNGVATGQSDYPTAAATIVDKTKHVNGGPFNVAFDAAFNPGTTGYTQSTGTPAYTCNNTYCHSNGTNAATPPANTSIAWNSATGTTCASCHGGYTGTIIATGSHTPHVNVTTNPEIGVAYHCDDCHATTVAGGATPTINYAGGLHVNRAKDGSIPARNLMTSTFNNTTCSAVYCHSSGRPSANGAVTASKYNSVTWGQVGALGCNGCHGTYTAADGATFGWTSAFGEPNYLNGGPNLVNSNSHSAHVGSAASCAVCHAQTTTDGLSTTATGKHTDGFRDVTWDAKRTTGGAVYTQGTKQCSSITCHGGGTPVWGGPKQTCLACHGTTGVETKDLGATFWDNGVTATINTTEWAYSGHGKASGSYDVTLNPAAAFPATPTAGTSECIFCHDPDLASAKHNVPTNPFRLRGVTNATGVSIAYDTSTPELANAVCLNCHSATGNGVDPDGTATAYTKKVATLKTPSWHGGAKHTTGSLGGKFCWDCHDPHGDRVNSTTNNIAMLANSVTRVSDGTYGYVGATGVQVAVTYKTEAATAPSTTLTEGKAVEIATAAGTQHVGICQACHGDTSEANWTKYWNRLGYEDSNGPPNTDRTLSSLTTSHNYGSTTVAYCISCHTHATGFGGECVGCHATTQPITKGPLAGTGNRDAVVNEFKNAWSHKRSTSPAAPANIVVKNQDCVPCHMEADPATATPSGLHGDGYVDLRDPDTGVQITGVTWGGTGAGAYTPTATAVRFPRFSRDLSKPLEGATADPNAATVQAIMINQCLKCHDSNGAAAYVSPLPLSPLLTSIPGSSPEKPFGQTIQPIANYTGTGIVANNVPGGVTDIYESFKTSNASYHPILGKNNNSYVNNIDMQAPWNALSPDKTRGTTTSWGYLISCWDCHAPFGTANTAVLTRTVTAHGGATTIRGSTFITNTTTTQFCRVCHLNVTSGHGTGSATATIDSNPTSRMGGQCHICHGSQTSTKPNRPIAAQDAHGFDSFAPAMGADKMWPLGATESYKPYAFMRNVGPSGQWRTGSNSWRPASAPGLTATTSGSCQGSLCRSSHGSYRPGGVY
jgi:predicted CxxxxCH...CXXCH cytochrome family protein